MSDRDTEETSCKRCILGLAEYTIDLWCCAGCLMDFGVHALQLSPHFFNVVVSVLGLPVGDLREIDVLKMLII